MRSIDIVYISLMPQYQLEHVKLFPLWDFFFICFFNMKIQWICIFNSNINLNEQFKRFKQRMRNKESEKEKEWEANIKIRKKNRFPMFCLFLLFFSTKNIMKNPLVINSFIIVTSLFVLLFNWKKEGKIK